MPLLLALMHIYCYCILCAGIPVNTIKKEKKQGLCRVLAHGKGTKCPLPCACSRQRGHASTNCVVLGWDLAIGLSLCRVLIEDPRQTEHG
jgi:hypothetical protein